jgi:recombination protein RecT
MANALAVLEQQLAPLAPKFEMALAGQMPVDRLIRTVMISVERAPALLDCDRQSLFNAAMSAACLGLEVDGVTGQAFLIPFARRAQLIIGYKGYNTLAARGGITIRGKIVREGDPFEWENGTGAYVRHKALPGNDRRIIAAWASAEHRDRPPVIEVLHIDELMAVKNKSPGAKKKDSPWNDPNVGFPAMCEKTAKRRLARSLPLTIIQLAARMESATDERGQAAWISPDHGLVVDGEATPIGPFEESETPTAPDLIEARPEPDNAYERYVIGVLSDPEQTANSLRAWWNSDQQKANRADVPQHRREALRAQVLGRIAQLDQAHAEAAP